MNFPYGIPPFFTTPKEAALYFSSSFANLSDYPFVEQHPNIPAFANP
jgi:hypothetical protein